MLALLLAFIAFLSHSSKQPTAASSSSSRSSKVHMGCASSSSQPQEAGDRQPERATNATIENNYSSLAEVESALRRAGLESSDLILASAHTTGTAAEYNDSIRRGADKGGEQRGEWVTVEAARRVGCTASASRRPLLTQHPCRRHRCRLSILFSLCSLLCVCVSSQRRFHEEQHLAG